LVADKVLTALLGVAANVRAGTLSKVPSNTLTGVVLTGTVEPIPSWAHEAFTLKPPSPVAVGFVTTDRTVALTGAVANAAAGTVSITVISLTGVAVQGLAGFVAAGSDVVRTLIGVYANVSVGTVVVAERSFALTGVVTNAAAGTVAVAPRSVDLLGVAANAAAGTATPIADRTAALVGVQANAIAYFVTSGQEVFASLVGVVSNVAVSFVGPNRLSLLGGAGVNANVTAGTVVAGADLTTPLTGVGMTARVGLVHRDALLLIGVGINAAAGSTVQTDSRKPLVPVVATVKAGFAPKEGDVMLETIGVEGAAGGVGIVGVGPPVTFGGDRHTGVRPARKTKADMVALEQELALMED
jgi:hypothetical protein